MPYWFYLKAPLLSANLQLARFLLGHDEDVILSDSFETESLTHVG